MSVSDYVHMARCASPCDRAACMGDAARCLHTPYLSQSHFAESMLFALPWPDTTPPTIGIEVSPRDGTNVPIGDVVSATVTVSGADSIIPTVLLSLPGQTTLRMAVTFNQSSPFLFSYTIKPEDTGRIAFAASVKDAAGNEATAELNTDLSAGNVPALAMSVYQRRDDAHMINCTAVTVVAAHHAWLTRLTDV